MKWLLNHWGNFIILVVFLVYSPALLAFFSQDDFTHLVIAKAQNIQEIIGFFSFKTSGIYYRPLSVQLITWLAQTLFGLRPFGFHAIALGLHGVSTIMVHKLIGRLTKSKQLALWGALFYGVNPVHFMSLFWWAEVSMVMAPLFSFLAILAWLDQKYGRFNPWFLLALLSNELAISVIPIVAILAIWKKQVRNLVKIWPTVIVGGIILGGRWLVVPPGLGSEYGMKFLPQIALANLRWQTIRALGFPEGFGGHLDLWSTRLAVLSIGLSLFLMLISAFRRKTLGQRFWLGLSWFVVALLPVLFLEHHQSPIYGVIGLPGLFLMFPWWLENKPVLGAEIWAGLFIMGSFFGIQAMNRYHWVTQRAREAKYYIEKLQAKNIKSDGTIVFIDTYPESSLKAYLALGAGNGIKVFFGDGVKVYFEDINETPRLIGGVNAHYVMSDFRD